MEKKEFIKQWMKTYEPDTFKAGENGRYFYRSEDLSSGIDLECFFEDLLTDFESALDKDTKQQSNCNLPQVINSDQLHTCKYCGAETTQPDEQCYKAEKKASVCDLNRLSESCETAHQLRGCKYCKYHREQTDL